MTNDVRKVWRVLRPKIKSACTFSEIKDIVSLASLPVEELTGLQQKSLPEKGATKSELLDAVESLISRDPDPDAAVHNLVHALWALKQRVRDTIAESVQAVGWTLENGKLLRSATAGTTPDVVKASPNLKATMSTETNVENIDIFISHSSRDSDLAEALIELLRAAFEIPHEKIRCTSVDGYRLSSGASTDEEIRREVHQCSCFIALLTPSSVQSAYVLFELGARWGARLRCLPLLAKGLRAESLGKPLSSLNSLSCSTTGQIHQFLADVGKAVGRNLYSAAAYDKYVHRLQRFHSETALGANSVEQEIAKDVTRSELGAESKALLGLIEEEPEEQTRGIVEILREIAPEQTMFFPRIQYAGNPSSMKTRAFRLAVEQLVAANRLHPPEDNPSRNTRTYEYRVRDEK